MYDFIRKPNGEPLRSYVIEPTEIAKCSGKRVAIDTETTGLKWYKNHCIGVGFWCPDADVYGYVPTLNKEDFSRVQSAIIDLDNSTTVIMHNLKFDFHFLGITPRHFKFVMDTTDLVHLIDSRYRKSAEWVEKIFLKTETKKFLLERMGRLKKRIWAWSLFDVAPYCVNDVRIEYEFAKILTPKVVDLDLWNLFLKDMDFIKDLWDIERRGIFVDQDFLKKSMDLQKHHLAEMEGQLFDACGRVFNWRSPQQLSFAIYEGLGIPKPKNPFAGADGIDRSRFADAGLYKSTCTSTFLLTEKVNHPLGNLISAIRESARMWKTMDKYLELCDGDSLIHTNFNQTGTRTGRLSSGEPNLQNVPSHVRGRFTQSVYTGSTHRDAEYNLRNAFVAHPGNIFVSVDYKQMEGRMFGILSQDPHMMEFLKNGQDIHGQIANRVWGTNPGDSMYSVHREWSKTISFGLIYGMTIGSLMFKLNMTKTQAAQVCDQYKAQFPRIDPWMNEVISECKAFGYVRYWSGRVWREDNPIDMYKGANAKIQGGCFDLLSIAELRVAKWLRNQGFDHFIWNLVHDEIIAEVPKDNWNDVNNFMLKEMQVPDIFDIPFATEGKIGPSYGSLDTAEIKSSHEDKLDDISWDELDSPSMGEELDLELDSMS